ncbi:MAG: alpha-L-arabinofuranosidase C-terminal domain-containing protein [Dysgonomonas sp.]|nr:alpha-L-arabinofuranosidase C-terminal domain-containing protein [Dysgonomonas sp.]
MQLNIYPDEELAEIKPEMYGIFFEDINFAADGGLYAELIKNRSFEFTHPLTGWTALGNVEIHQDNPCFNRNPNYARLILKSGNYMGAGLENEGFRGIALHKGNEYRLTFYARLSEGGKANLHFGCITSKNDITYKNEMEISGTEWTKYTATIIPGETDDHSRFRIWMGSEGSIDIDHISLFPTNTWQDRENGMRQDLAQALYDLDPGVFRFPGGCIVEGTTLENRYQWKNSIGPVENRPYNTNRWYYSLRDRLTPDYFQSYGLGFFEYFLLCEDFGAEPLPILSCGIACQFESSELVCIDDLQPYIDDALDLIEFANGSPMSEWGKIRAEMGHPEPFNLKMIGIGNEQWGKIYPERLELFVTAIRAKYPNILIVGGSGVTAQGDDYDYLWKEMKRIGVDLVDEHYYMPPEWFLHHAGRYDSFDRKGPKVFAGEYAAHDMARDKANTFYSALSEAAYMTGLERNADIVHMATYAPLMAHIDAWQWRPDMIWFNNSAVVKTPNYYVQQLYAQNSGTHTIRITSNDSDLKGSHDLYATAALDKNNSELIIKVVNTSNQPKNLQLELNGRKWKLHGKPKVTVLQSDDLSTVNDFEHEHVSPKIGKAVVEKNTIHILAKKHSFNIIRVEYLK